MVATRFAVVFCIIIFIIIVINELIIVTLGNSRVTLQSQIKVTKNFKNKDVI